MAHTPSHITVALQLDDYSRVLRLFDATNATLRSHEARMDAHIGTICGILDTDARQDTALTEAESRIADLEERCTKAEQVNGRLWAALDAQRAQFEQCRTLLARLNLRMR